VLVITQRALNAQIILGVNGMAGGVPLFATFDRYAALTGGISACEWHVMRSDRQIVPADPLQLPPMTVADYTASAHYLTHFQMPNDTAQDRYPTKVHQTYWNGISLDKLPASLSRLLDLDRLNDASCGTLTFLAAHPVCPTSTLAKFKGVNADEAASVLHSLQEVGFAEPISENPREMRWSARGVHVQNSAHCAPEARRILTVLQKQDNIRLSDIARSTELPVPHVKKHLDQLEAEGLVRAMHRLPEHLLWAATDIAVELVAARALQPADRAVQRHRFFRADHIRRSQHTRETYAFFEKLHSHCVRRSRASASFDANAHGADDGMIPFYELIDFESEMTAAAWYVLRGQARLWRPDGYGLLRAGRDFTPFWLEIDGTTTTRSRRDAALWEDKLGRMCDYFASDHWRMKHDVFPRLLIVSSSVRQRAVVAEALEAAARSRSIAAPPVFMTGHEALAQRSPLGPIWFQIAPATREPTFAFDGVTPQVVQPAARPRSLLDDLNRADQIGLIDVIAPQAKRESVR
jgi:DNA-binding Lrp family transcriptional regulator